VRDEDRDEKEDGDGDEKEDEVRVGPWGCPIPSEA